MRKFFFSQYLERSEDTCGGAARIKGHRITVDCITSRFAAGESLDEIAKDYGVSRPSVDAAVRLVLYVQGSSLWSKRALAKLDQVLTLRTGLRL